MAHSQSVNCSLDDIDLNALKVSSFLFCFRRGMRGDEGFMQWTSGGRWRMWILGGMTKYFFSKRRISVYRLPYRFLP